MGGARRRSTAARVGEGAGAAEAVEGLVPAEGGDEVRRECVQRRPAVPRGAVAAEAGAIVEVRREEAAQEPVAGVRHRRQRDGALVRHCRTFTQKNKNKFRP